jgi:tetratricopeptide (TPR) repeat protein
MVAAYSFALSYTCGGLHVEGYHVVNVALHLLTGLTLWGLLRRTLRGPKLRQRFGRAGDALALAVALLWLLHPLQTQAVDYIVQRMEIMMALGYLLTLYAVARMAEASRARRIWLWGGAAWLSCLLGMLSKEVMVSAPLVAIVFDRVFFAASWRQLIRRRGVLYLALLATLGVYPLLGLSELGVGGVKLGFSFTPMTPGRYLLAQPPVILHYLRLAIWPHRLIFDYGSGVLPGVGYAGLCAAMLALLLLVTMVALWRWPAAGFLGLAFFAILAPTSSLVPLPDVCVEHRMYLPLAALATLLVTGLYALWQRLGSPQIARVPSLAMAAAAAVALGAVTWQRNWDYHSDVNLWQDTVGKCPENARAQNNLAQALIDAGRPAQALPHAEQALRLQPNYVVARYNLAMALHGAGQYRQAAEEFTATLRLAPDYAMAHNGLGLCLESLGDRAQATAHYDQALKTDPTCAMAHYNLGNLLAGQGHLPEAVDHYHQALALRPDYAKAYVSLGNALAALGQLPLALAQLQQGAQSCPDQADIFYNLGNTLAAMGRPADALPRYQRALQLDPSQVGAHNNMAAALATLGRLAEAVPHFEFVAQAQPDSPQAQQNLGRALWGLGRLDQAIAHLQVAAELARSRGQPQLARDINAQLSACRGQLPPYAPTAAAAMPQP